MNEKERLELVKYRIQRATETLEEIHLHIENGLWNTAVNRLYYACYYAVSALLAKHEIFPKTHAGVRQMFGLHFIKTETLPVELGAFYSDIFDKRQTGDYDDFVIYKKEDVVDLMKPANELIKEVKFLLQD